MKKPKEVPVPLRRGCVRIDFEVIPAGQIKPSQKDAAWMEVARKHLPQGDLEFSADKKIATLWASQRPLGLMGEVKNGADGKRSIFVKDFTYNSYCEHMGVQVGWRIIKVDDEDVLEGKGDPEQARKLVNTKLAPMKVWPLIVEFETPLGLKTYKLENTPVGCKISDQAPMYIEEVHPNSQAAKLGMKDKRNYGQDWIL